MSEEIARHLTTKNKLSDVETSYASLIDAMEKEKNCHKETLDKLAVEESNHMITQTELKESKDKLVDELAKHMAAMDQERSNAKEALEKYLNVQKEYDFEQANSKKNANLANTLQGQLDGELKHVEDLVKKLANEQSNHKQVQQSFDMVQQENAVCKVHYFRSFFQISCTGCASAKIYVLRRSET